MEGFIYKVTNINNNKVYIGQTSRTIEERWNQHKRNAFHDNNLEYQNKFHRAIRKYGIGGFIIEEQERIIGVNEEDLHQKLNDAETKWILHFDSKDNGYNSSLGGDYNPMYGVRGKDNPCSVKINQYTLDGKYIKTWNSFADIIRELGDGNYVKVCSSKRIELRKVTAKGYVWRYYDEFSDCKDIVISEEEFEIRNSKKKGQFSTENNREALLKALDKTSKKVDQFDSSGNFIKTFDSIHEAAREVGGAFSTIQSAVKKGNLSKGYYWKFHKI